MSLVRVRPSSRRRALLGGGSAAATALLAACGAQTGPGAGSQGQIKEAVTIDYQHRWEGVREPVQVVWRKTVLPVEEVALDPAGGDVTRQLWADRKSVV